MTAPEPKLRWYQYSMRTLFVFVAFCALPCSWVAVKKEQGSRQAEAVAEIEKLGGRVEYDWLHDAKGNPLPNAQNPGPSWLRPVLGDDFFQRVVRVSFMGSSLSVTDAGLEHLKGMSQLQSLFLWKTQVTDAGLEQLKGMSQLQVLYLDGTQVTDAGLEHLKDMSQLQSLNLCETQVTDAGLEHLRGMSQLQGLDLGGTQVTDASVKKLKQALPKCDVAR